jgi:hypothetical protein
MAETQSNDAKVQPFAFLDSLYEQTAGECSQPLAFGLFDLQLCGRIDIAWLLQQADQCGTTEAEIMQLVETGAIRTWMDRDGNRGFLLYTPRQIKTLKDLQALGRYDEEELRHIMTSWDSDIECTLEIVPYDDLDISDFEHFRRRIAEHIEDAKQQIEWQREYPSLPGQSTEGLDRLNAEVQAYEKVARKLERWATTTHTKEMRDWIGRNLFRMRWVDEWIRMNNAEKYRAAIVQGFGPEVFFGAYSQSGSDFTFDRIDWRVTLRQLQHRVSQGKPFPLRTPDFDLTQAGLILHHQPTPDAYAELYERYKLVELQEAIKGMGPELWTAASYPKDSAACAGCGALFLRTLAGKQYCSERCRSRAKQRRYRERDPERARLAQARYWRGYEQDDPEM